MIQVLFRSRPKAGWNSTGCCSLPPLQVEYTSGVFQHQAGTPVVCSPNTCRAPQTFWSLQFPEIGCPIREWLLVHVVNGRGAGWTSHQAGLTGAIQCSISNRNGRVGPVLLACGPGSSHAAGRGLPDTDYWTNCISHFLHSLPISILFFPSTSPQEGKPPEPCLKKTDLDAWCTAGVSQLIRNWAWASEDTQKNIRPCRTQGWPLSVI